MIYTRQSAQTSRTIPEHGQLQAHRPETIYTLPRKSFLAYQFTGGPRLQYVDRHLEGDKLNHLISEKVRVWPTLTGPQNKVAARSSGLGNQPISLDDAAVSVSFI